MGRDPVLEDPVHIFYRKINDNVRVLFQSGSLLSLRSFIAVFMLLLFQFRKFVRDSGKSHGVGSFKEDAVSAFYFLLQILHHLVAV